MKLYKTIFILFITWVLLSACTKEKPNNEKKLGLLIDKKLTEISVYAGVIYTSMHLQNDLNCLTAGQISLKKSAEEKKLLQNIRIGGQNMCDFYQQAIFETAPIFNEIKQKKSLLEKLYFFSIYLPDDDSNDSTMREEDIGLFSSWEKCEKIESLARSYDIPTRKCIQWDEKAFLGK